MKTLLITDTETTGLDHAKDATIEVAICVYDVEHAQPVEWFSTLIRHESNGAEAINKIPVSLLATAAEPAKAWKRAAGIIGGALERGPAAYVAHRAEFDHGFYPPDLAARAPWICSKFDVEFPRSKVGDSLVQVAIAHDVPVVAAHRALTDVQLLVRIQRCAELGADVPAMLTRAMRPKARFTVSDRAFDPARNKLAKAAGFAWDGPSKTWGRSMAIEDAAGLPFAVTQETSR